MVLAISIAALVGAAARGAYGMWRGESVGSMLVGMLVAATMCAVGIVIGKYATSDDQDD